MDGRAENCRKRESEPKRGAGLWVGARMLFPGVPYGRAHDTLVDPWADDTIALCGHVQRKTVQTLGRRGSMTGDKVPFVLERFPFHVPGSSL